MLRKATNQNPNNASKSNAGNLKAPKKSFVKKMELNYLNRMIITQIDKDTLVKTENLNSSTSKQASEVLRCFS